MRVAVAQNIDRDSGREVEVALTVLAVEIGPFAAHWPHRRTRINGHERRDRQGFGSLFVRRCGGFRAYSQRAFKGQKGAPCSTRGAFPYASQTRTGQGQLVAATAPAVVPVAPAAAAIVDRELNLLLEPLDSVRNVARLARIEAVACLAAQPAIDLVGFIEQAVRTSPAAHVAA